MCRFPKLFGKQVSLVSFFCSYDHRQWRLVNHKQNCLGIYRTGCTQLGESSVNVRLNHKATLTSARYSTVSTFGRSVSESARKINTLLVLPAIWTTGANKAQYALETVDKTRRRIRWRELTRGDLSQRRKST